MADTIHPMALQAREAARSMSGRFGNQRKPAAPEWSPGRRLRSDGIPKLGKADWLTEEDELTPITAWSHARKGITWQRTDQVQRGVLATLATEGAQSTVPVLYGDTGDGKTSVMKKMARTNGMSYYKINTADLGLGEVSGLPFPRHPELQTVDGELPRHKFVQKPPDEETRRAAMDDSGRLLDARGNPISYTDYTMPKAFYDAVEECLTYPDRLVLFNFDEINRAPKEVLNQLMAVFSEHQLGNVMLPPNFKKAGTANIGVGFSATTRLEDAQRARIAYFNWPPKELLWSSEEELARKELGYPSPDLQESQWEYEEDEHLMMVDWLHAVKDELRGESPSLVKDLGKNPDSYVKFGVHLSKEDLDAWGSDRANTETAFPTGRTWEDFSAVASSQLLRTSSYTDTDEGIVPTSKVDHELLEITCEAFLGQRTARALRRKLVGLHLPKAKDLLNDPAGEFVKKKKNKVERVDQATAVGQAITRTMASHAANSDNSAARVKQGAVHLKSLAQFATANLYDDAGNASSSHAIVMDRVADAITSTAEANPAFFAKVVDSVTNDDQWMKSHPQVVTQLEEMLTARQEIMASVASSSAGAASSSRTAHVPRGSYEG